jgi:hypothetical protein
VDEAPYHFPKFYFYFLSRSEPILIFNQIRNGGRWPPWFDYNLAWISIKKIIFLFVPFAFFSFTVCVRSKCYVLAVLLPRWGMSSSWKIFATTACWFLSATQFSGNLAPLLQSAPVGSTFSCSLSCAPPGLIFSFLFICPRIVHTGPAWTLLSSRFPSSRSVLCCRKFSFGATVARSVSAEHAQALLIFAARVHAFLESAQCAPKE